MKLPIIQVPARPKGLRFEVTALADPRFEVDTDTAVIEIFDIIGFFGVSESNIAWALRGIGPKPVTVKVNSPGGDAFAGMTIYNQLRAHGHPIKVQILGLAASAASIIAMAGDRIEIAKNAQGMIHRAQGGAYGDADFMRVAGTVLDKLDAAAAELYHARTGLPVEQISAMMAADTFMSAEEMIGYGFADVLLDRDAEPAPKALATEGPQSLRDLETQLRTLGISKSKASKAAAAAWPAMSREGEEELFDFEALAARLDVSINAARPSR